MTLDRLSIGTLRHAAPADVPAIHAMTQTSYAGYRDRLPDSSLWQETAADVMEELQAGAIVLCEVEDRLVGSVRCQVRQDLPGGKPFVEPFVEPFVYVHRLAVLPQFQRRGIGQRLMHAVEHFAQEQGVTWVRLEARLAQPENQAFYDRLGYLPGAASRWFADGSPRSIWMVKALS